MSLSEVKDSEINAEESNSWLNWCRLCAKEEEAGQETLNIFTKLPHNVVDSSLATAIGKYFWVNIKVQDHIPKKLCSNCNWLIEELLYFTEHVNKVQAMYCLLENIKPMSLEHAKNVRKQCGLINEDWQHLAYKRNELFNCNEESGKFKNDIEKTDNDNMELEEDAEEFILITNELEGDTTIHLEKHLSTKESEIKHKLSAQELDHSDKKVIIEKQEHEHEHEHEQQQMHHYVYELQQENVLNRIALKRKRVKLEAEKSCTEEKENVEGVEVNDSNLYKQLKFHAHSQHSANDDDDDDDDDDDNGGIVTDQGCIKILKITDEDKGADQRNSSQAELQVEEDADDIGEMDDKNVEAVDDEEFLPNECESKTNSDNNTSADTFDFLKKRPRGRPTNSSRGYKTDVRYICGTCKRKYKNPNIYRKHMESVHQVIVEQLPDFVCSVCNKDFQTQSRLKKHLRTHLPDDMKFKWPCPHCHRKFSHVGAVRVHVTSVHEQIKPFICDQCGRACKTLSALNEHQLVHTNECPFECEVCKKRFKNKARLKTHLDIHAGDTYVCPDCGLKLNTRRTLQAHRLVHSDEKRYKCQFCEAAFKRVKAFKNHLILHTGMRPYKCNFCSKTFSNGSNCRSHKRKSHPKELAELEAQGEKPEPVIIPKLEDLKSVKTMITQPRKVRRYNKKKDSSEFHHMNDESQDASIYDDGDDDGGNEEVHEYEIEEELLDEDDEDEDCEETVIYEFIDEM